jgi:hypothetical protein
MTTATHLGVTTAATERPGMAALLETRLALGPRHAAGPADPDRDYYLLLELARRLVHDLAGPHLEAGDLDEPCPGCGSQLPRRDCPVRTTVSACLTARSHDPSAQDPVRVTWVDVDGRLATRR